HQFQVARPRRPTGEARTGFVGRSPLRHNVRGRSFPWFRVSPRQGSHMAAAPLTAQDLQLIRDLAAGWGKIVAKRAFGEAGPGLGLDFAALEEVPTAAAASYQPATRRRPWRWWKSMA